MGDHFYCGIGNAIAGWFGLKFPTCGPEGMEYISGPTEGSDPKGEIAPFWIDATEVTQGQFRAYRESVGDEYREMSEYGKSRGFEGENKPMIYVTWEEARAYCRAKGGDLPTKAQWVKAARGPEGKIYGTESGEISPDEANYLKLPSVKELDKEWDKFKETAGPKDVASYAPNDYGLYDMTANVWEWVLDDDEGMFKYSGEIWKHVCGDTWYIPSDAVVSPASLCGSSPPEDANDLNGFRCVVPD